MNFSEYQKLSRETAIYPNLGNNLYYPTLGLCGEAGEVAEKVVSYNGYIQKNKLMHSKILELTKELGDILWYISNLGIEAELQLNKIAGLESFKEVQDTINFDYASLYDTLQLFTLRICAHTGQVAEAIKKTYRDNNGLLSNEKQNLINVNLYHIIFIITEVCTLIEIDFETVAIKNIEKLNERMKNNKLHGSGDNR
jgi:NTP pyrophosphatase (non-canonical NTP hydrolase)